MKRAWKRGTLIARVSSGLPFALLLGLDSLAVLGLVVDLKRRVWTFSGEPDREFEFESILGPEGLEICTPIAKLTGDQADRLEKFLSMQVPRLREAPGLTHLITHKIEVGDALPIKQRYRTFTPIIRDWVYREVDRLLEADVIEPSASEWNTPIVMVPKPNGTYRFCLDFRKVNEVSKKDAYPLPFMSNILDCLRSANYISTLDLSQAFHQIPLEPESREITAFTVPYRGLFHFKRMPFGLTNGLFLRTSTILSWQRRRLTSI